MAYRFKLGEPVPQGARRVVREEIASAVRQLSGEGEANLDDAIHEARKSMKKIRGVLRLMRPELGEIYRRENTFFRDVGLKLSQFRDAGAMLEIFDALRARYRGEMDGRTLASIRRRLMARKKQGEQQADITAVLAAAAATLRESAPGVSAWPLAKDGFAAIALGLQATFREGRNAMSRARETPLAENYHEWRKRVKAHWYHIRLLESLWSPGIAEYEKRLKDLETALGEDHNLVMLRERVREEPESGRIGRLIRKYQKQLRDNALELGAHIYEEKPGHLSRRIQHLWEGWQATKTAAGKRPSSRRSAMSASLVTAGNGNRDGDPSGPQAPRGAPQ